MVLVAGELVDPQVPEGSFVPPSVRLLTLMVAPAGMLATAVPLKDKLPLIVVVPVCSVFVPLLDNTRLL